MKTITFTINGDVAAAIDKTIKLRAASPRISNIVEVRIVRSQAAPTTYWVKFIIPEHVEIDVAYTINGVHKSINRLSYDSTETERTITVDAGSTVDVQFAVDSDWVLEDASEKHYTINENKTITIPEPHEAGPTPYTLSWNIGPADNVAQYDGASFGITYVKKKKSGDYEDAETININTTGSKTVYEGDIVIFWDNCTTFWSATGATFERNERIVIGTSDVHVTGEVPSNTKTITFITNPNVSAVVQYTHADGTVGQAQSIGDDSPSKTIIVQNNTKVSISYTSRVSGQYVPKDERSLEFIISEDMTITFPGTIVPAPSVGLQWLDNVSNAEYFTVSEDGTNLDAYVHLEDLHFNDVGIESYNQFFFVIWDDDYGMDVKPESCNPIIEPVDVAPYFAVLNDGAGSGGGSLTLIKDIRENILNQGSYTLGGKLKFKPAGATKAAEFTFNITFIL